MTWVSAYDVEQQAEQQAGQIGQEDGQVEHRASGQGRQQDDQAQSAGERPFAALFHRNRGKRLAVKAGPWAPG